MSCHGCDPVFRRLVHLGAVALPSIAVERAGPLVNERHEACMQCGSLQVHYGQHFCGTPIVGGLLKPSECGCWLDIKWRIKSAACPQGRWET